jgi:1,4-alpha-glucan branching enzyme
MGSELAQEQEWSEERSLDWHLLEDPDHAGVQALVRDLNAAYRNEPALWEADFTPDGFMWLEPNAASENVLAFLRRSADDRSVVLCLANLSPVVRESWRVGLPVGGSWVEILNTDSRFYGGSDVGNGIGLRAESVPWNDQPFSAEVVLPPLAVVWLVPEKKRSASPAQVSTKRR